MKTPRFLVLTFVTILAASLGPSAHGQSSSGPYLGLDPPGKSAQVFAPWLLGSNMSPGCSGFLRDGMVFVFSAMKPGSDWRFKSTFVTELKDGNWTEPRSPLGVITCPTTLRSVRRARPSTSPLSSLDKTSSVLLEQANIWAVTLRDSGWTEPVMLGASLNTEAYDENYPTVSSNGTVYYMSRRADSVGKTDIYRSENLDGKYGEAEGLGEPVNSPSPTRIPSSPPTKAI